jgi:hypothetical protein
VLEHFHGTVQPPTQVVRAFVQRTLQIAIVDGSGNGYLRTVCVSLEKGIRHLGKRENQMVAWGLAAGKGMVRRRAVERYPPHRRL